MAKFYGEVGYGETHKTGPGVMEDVIKEISYFGDVLRNTRGVETDQKVIPDITVGNSISIVADAYAFEHFFAIRYVKWQGVYWEVSNVEVQHPRLVLRLGGVYNGITAEAPGNP